MALLGLWLCLFALLVKIQAEEFDHIVVGAGTSGAILATRLALAGNRVLLLEAGPENTVPNVFGVSNLLIPRYEYDNLNDEDVSNVFYSEPMPASLFKRAKITVGKGPGGSSRLATSYARPPVNEFDSWGIPGWDAAGVTEYFKRFEVNGNPGPLSGVEGFMPIFRGPDHSGADLFEAAANNLGFPSTDFSQGQLSFGVGALSHLQNPNYFRLSSGFYLNFPTGGLLQTRFEATVTKVTFDQFTSPIVATGVEYLSKGIKKQASCRKEVILAAGTLGSPKILEFSGVGGAQLLASLKIPVVADLPAVGENLAMLPSFSILISLNSSFEEQGDQGFFSPANIGQFASGAGGFFAYHHAGSVLASTTAGSFGLPDFTITYSTVLPPFTSSPGIVSTACTVVNPASRGSTHLQSTNPYSDPKVQPNLYANPADVAAALTCLGTARAVANTPPASQYLLAEVLPSASFSTPETMAYYVLTQSNPTTESFGTVKMGLASDSSAVVTPDLLVKGFANLRVADLSIVPSPVRFGGVSVGMMIGEKAADLILAAGYSSNIDPTHGLSVVQAFHGHALVTDATQGINDHCAMAGSRSLNLSNDVTTCECQEAIAALVELGAPEAWIGPQKSTCRSLSAAGTINVVPCTNLLPVLCKK